MARVRRASSGPNAPKSSTSMESTNTGSVSAKARATCCRCWATFASWSRRTWRGGTSSEAPKPAPSTAFMHRSRSASLTAALKVITAFSNGKLTLTLATPSTLFNTRSTEATHAPQVMPETLNERVVSSMSFTRSGAARHQFPLAVVQGHAAASAGAHPAHAVPALAAFGPRVEALHLAIAFAALGDDSGHAIACYVVNINAAF